MKYTVIYRDCWLQGSHMVTLVQMKRIETEDLAEWLRTFEYSSGVEFIFMGWPPQQGDAVPEKKLDDKGEFRTIRIGDDFVKRVVPHGIYCYDHNGICPFWDKFTAYPDQSSGYCGLLERGDWMHGEGGTMLLWDQCKECGVNNDDPIDRVETDSGRSAQTLPA